MDEGWTQVPNFSNIRMVMGYRGLISAPPIPVGFRSFLSIPVEFTSQNFTPATKLWRYLHRNGPRNPVTGMAPESSDQN